MKFIVVALALIGAAVALPPPGHIGLIQVAPAHGGLLHGSTLGHAPAAVVIAPAHGAINPHHGAAIGSAYHAGYQHGLTSSHNLASHGAILPVHGGHHGVLPAIPTHHGK
ncbi:unnamed protein product [Hermetia illucens]|uniref:Uncharacterized protein n=1 Tax=Hermetia illucens TaxID=343691 RepID=A0A7R8UHD0_HERIL|nr:uncharacterized protein LOC119648683 [Hermetia illucens]CAD7080915.1 unnamed protein product [Hermetia illucens]